MQTISKNHVKKSICEKSTEELHEFFTRISFILSLAQMGVGEATLDAVSKMPFSQISAMGCRSNHVVSADSQEIINNYFLKDGILSPGEISTLSDEFLSPQ